MEDTSGKKEIAKREEGLVPMLSGNSLGDVLKPLMREIHLFDTFIAGTAYINDGEALAKLKPGDELTLLRENSKFDENAIMIRDAESHKLGYIPEKDNAVFSRLMDAGKKLTAKVNGNGSSDGFATIAIGIYLVDF